MSQGDQELFQASKLTGLVGQIGCVTGFVSILIIGVAFAVGRFLDSIFETGGLFTILFLLGSFPITIYAIVRISLFALNRAQYKNNDTESTIEEKSAT